MNLVVVCCPHLSPRPHHITSTAEERAFWLRREKVLQPEEVDDFKLEGEAIKSLLPQA